MAELRIPIDPWNPGQFYACCGLIELFGLKSSTGTASYFDLNPGQPRFGDFIITSESELDINSLIRDLRAAKYSFIEESEKSVWPVEVLIREETLILDWWLNPFRSKPTHIKCWAGQVTTGKLIEELTTCLPLDAGTRLFESSRMMKSKFGIDPRSAWNSLGVGYSPNEHQQDSATFPAVELLAAIGLQGFGPEVKTRGSVKYHAWRSALPRICGRRAARTPWKGLDVASYEFEIAKRGQSYKYFTFARQEESLR